MGADLLRGQGGKADPEWCFIKDFPLEYGKNVLRGASRIHQRFPNE